MNYLLSGFGVSSLLAQSPEGAVQSACKSASELVAAAKAKRANETRIVLEDGVADVDEELEKAKREIGISLDAIRIMLLGDTEKESDEATQNRVAEAAASQGLARCLTACLLDLPLESLKAAAQVFSNLVLRKSFAQHVVQDGFTLEALCSAFAEKEMSLACGSMLREAAAAHDFVTAILLRSSSFWLFMTDYVQSKNFDVAADAFKVFETLLLSHPQISSTFILENYDFFFECYNRLFDLDYYVTCCESLRLLSEILLHRAHYAVMIKYVASRDNLKIIMLLLRSKKLRVQIEAFHVFKIFVANPRKPKEVVKVLFDNRDKLVAYLKTFQNDKIDDQFLEEKELIIDTLLGLQDDPSQETEPTR